MGSRRAVEIIDRYFRAIRCMDQEEWVACFARDGAFFTSEFGAVRGHDALRNLFPLVSAAFGGLQTERESIIETGHAVAVGWRRHAGGISASGLDVFDIDGAGRLRAVRASWTPAESRPERLVHPDRTPGVSD